jgi:hypothetical protein
MTVTTEQARAYALIEEFFGTSDPAADRVVEVLHAQAAALEWIRDTTGTYPAPAPVAVRIAEVAHRLRTCQDDREPMTVLRETAEQALADYRAAA